MGRGPALAGLLLAVAVTAGGSPTAHAELVPCGTMVYLGTPGAATRVTIHNNYGTTIRVYLRSPPDSSTWVVDVAPGASYPISAYENQVFRITDWDGRCLTSLIVRAGDGYVSVG